MNGQGMYRGSDGQIVRGLFVDDNLVESEGWLYLFQIFLIISLQYYTSAKEYLSFTSTI